MRSIIQDRDKNGNPKPTIANILTIMDNAKMYEGIRYNELSGRAEIHSRKAGEIVIEPWTDADEAHSMNYIENAFCIYSREKHSAALRILFDSRKYNPIRDIVDSIEWDGENADVYPSGASTFKSST